MKIKLGIIGLSIILIIIAAKKTKGNVLNNNNNDYNRAGEKEKLLYTRFFDEIEDIKEEYSYTVPTAYVLAVIDQESDSAFLTKENADIIGDKNFKNKAYGFMQVRLPAMLDVNSTYGLSLSEQDLLDERNNLIAGIGYLNYCYAKAQDEKANNVFRSTFQKYNAGISTKETSLRGGLYASNVFKKFQKYGGLV